MREDGAWLAGKAAVPTDDATNDVLALEPEALEMADSQGVEAALGWIQTRRASPRHDSACYCGC